MTNLATLIRVRMILSMIPGSLVIHVHKFVAHIIHCGLNNLLHERVEFGLVKLHGEETVVFSDSPAFFRFILLPSIEAKIDVGK